MGNFNVGDYGIVIRISMGYMIASAPDFGITITKRFDEVRKNSDVGDLYFTLLDKITKDIQRRVSQKEKIPAPIKPMNLKNIEAPSNIGIRQAAQFLNLSEDTVRRLADSKKLKSTLTPGGHRRFKRDDLELYRSSSSSLSLV